MKTFLISVRWLGRFSISGTGNATIQGLFFKVPAVTVELLGCYESTIGIVIEKADFQMHWHFIAFTLHHTWFYTFHSKTKWSTLLGTLYIIGARSKIRKILLFQLKLGRKAVKMGGDINIAFGERNINVLCHNCSKCFVVMTRNLEVTTSPPSLSLGVDNWRPSSKSINIQLFGSLPLN